MKLVKVFRLPDTMHRQWRAVEDDLRRMLTSVGVIGPDAEHVVATLKPLFIEFCGPGNFDFKGKTGDEAVAEFNAWVFRMQGGLLTQIAAREIELLRLGAR